MFSQDFYCLKKIPTNYIIFRKAKTEFNSIENVFNTVISFIKNDVKKIELPNDSKGVFPRLKNIWFVRNLTAKIIHITGHDHYLILGLRNKKTILTIHDIEVLKRNKGVKRLLLKKLWFDWPIKYSSVVTTISNFTKQELLELNNYTTKIKVIHNPLTLSIKYTPKDFNSNKPNILQIGVKTNKNIYRLIEALNGISCHLTIIAKPNSEIIAALNKNNVMHTFKSGLTNDEMIEEYYKCDLVSFVSTYEGFGLPIIEAQAAGRLVLTSNIASMPEIAGDSCLMVNPFSVSEIRDGIMKLIQNENIRNEFILKGLKNIERFQPKIIADRYLELYNNLNK